MSIHRDIYGSALMFHHAIFTSRYASVLVSLSIAISSNIIALYYFFPGEIDPLWPFHNDSYVPALISRDTALVDTAAYPRPLFIFLLHFTGALGIRGSLFITYCVALITPIFVFILCATILNIRISVRYYVSLFVYLFLFYSHPYWYVWSNFDINGQLSLLFSSLAILAAIRGCHWGTIVCFILASLSKETYWITCGILLLWAHNRLSLQIKLALIFLGSSIVLSLLHSTVVYSTFLSGIITQDPTNNYAVSYRPIDILINLAKYIYLGYGFHESGSWIIIFMLCTPAILTRHSIINICFLILSGVSTIIFNSILSNHFFAGYSLNTAYFFYASVLLFPTSLSSRYRRILVIGGLLIGIGFFRNYNDSLWYYHQQLIQRDLLISLELRCSELRNQSVRVLIRDLNTVFTPFYYGGGGNP